MTARSSDTLPDPDAVVRAVESCPDVVRLSGGVAGEIASYLPGRSVPGVRVRRAGDVSGEPASVEVHVVGRYGPHVTDIAGQVRAAVRALGFAGPVHVGVDDLEQAVDPAPARDSR